MSFAHERSALMQVRVYVRSLSRFWKQPPLANIALMVNPRLSRSTGRYVPGENTIELNPAVLHAPARDRREIVCHEAAHAVVWARYGRKARPHGPEWQAIVRQAGFEPRASLVRCGHRAQPRSPQRFRHVCDVCHFARTANRRMPNWRCPECRAIGLEGNMRIQRAAPKR